MADITTKAELMQVIQTERQHLTAALDGLSDAEMIRPGQNGDLSVKDTLAHIAEWEQQCLGWYRAGQRGETPNLPNADISEVVDRLNRAIYEKHRDRTLADVRAWYESSYTEILAAIEAMTEGEIFSPGRYEWTAAYPLLVVLRANTDEHYAEHAAEITRWREEQGIS
jgi:hypothetical protein